jgi:hypothetical protein
LNTKSRGNYLINTNYFSIFYANFLGVAKKNLMPGKEKPHQRDLAGFHMRKVVKEIKGKSDGGKAIVDKVNVNKLTNQYH